MLLCRTLIFVEPFYLLLPGLSVLLGKFRLLIDLSAVHASCSHWSGLIFFICGIIFQPVTKRLLWSDNENNPACVSVSFLFIKWWWIVGSYIVPLRLGVISVCFWNIHLHRDDDAFHQSFLTVCRDVLLVGLGDEMFKGQILHLCSLALLSGEWFKCLVNNTTRELVHCTYGRVCSLK